ncbi:DNA-3-methyladenine glycosylase I [Jeongeupia chitinilytica]|uniref:DNA-3-methyladenine glycosylase I n=1 Tax=Jeongeupia chitinilytica TaxID=1041641 RepID=A0ABQ3GWF6_9NEIS|nr:DNA-3-methyladenine glycosylase I [Jeongeupia chitinilytica]GHD55647.1 DNA-3-methyladenine glycosylase I [Jeongeupia chitinilytica]
MKSSVIVCNDGLPRCGWLSNDPLYLAYHDDEWGVPCHDERTLFEMLCLEGMQAGLSWLTVLKKRDGYRRAFCGFDPAAIAAFGADDIERLVLDPGIIRHRGKIEAIVGNARALLELHARGDTLARTVWDVVGGAPKINAPASLADVPASTMESDLLSKRLKKLGFRFVGSTTCYAFMQACGLVDDHVAGCCKHR